MQPNWLGVLQKNKEMNIVFKKHSLPSAALQSLLLRYDDYNGMRKNDEHVQIISTVTKFNTTKFKQQESAVKETLPGVSFSGIGTDFVTSSPVALPGLKLVP